MIDILPDQKKIEGLGGNMRLGGQDVDVQADTLAAELFAGRSRVRMRFRHRYEVDPKYIETLEAGGAAVETMIELLEFGLPTPADFEPSGPLTTMPGG